MRLALAMTALFALVITAHAAVSLDQAHRSERSASRAIDLIAYANVLLDDLDHERSEAIYLAAAGAHTNPDDFRNRTAMTDESAALLRSGLFPGDAPSPLGARQQVIAWHGFEAMEQLAPLRARVLDRQSSAPDIARAYTAIIDVLITDMGRAAGLVVPGRENFEPAFGALSRLDDRTGLETGIGFVGFALGSLPEELAPVFAESVEIQSAQRRAFEALAPHYRVRELDGTLAVTTRQSVLEARRALQASASGAPLDEAHRKSWADEMKARQVDLSVLRNRFVREELEAVAAEGAARREARVTRASTGLGVLALALVGVIAGLRPWRPRTRRRPRV